MADSNIELGRLSRERELDPVLDRMICVATLMAQWRQASGSGDVCALGRLVTRVCAMTFAVAARLIGQTLLARMSAGQ